VDEDLTLPIKWRRRAPDGRSAGSISQFVREYLVRHGGTCTRDELLQAIRREPALSARLDRSQGFDRVLQNMRYRGFVMISGDSVKASPRTIRRTLVD
jgi:hypothetical protein